MEAAQRRSERARDGGLTQRKALALLALALVLSMATWFSASAVIPQLKIEWDLGPGEAAWLTIAIQLGFVVGALAAAAVKLSDVVAPQRVITVGALGAGDPQRRNPYSAGLCGTPAGLTPESTRHALVATDPQAPATMRGRT